MRREYDFSDGVRGKHHKAMETGYTITIHNADGTKVTQDVMPKEGLVILEPDVRSYYFFSTQRSQRATEVHRE